MMETLTGPETLPEAENPAVTEPAGDIRVGLALGGGGACGIAHIPLLEAVDELGLSPAIISGTSIGAIFGAGLAAGMSPHDIREAMLTKVGSSMAFAGVVWKSMLPASFLTALSKDQGFAPFNIERIIRTILPETMPERIEQLKLPFRCVATDYYGHREVVFERGSLHAALSASSALPGLFLPVVVNDRVMLDGAIMNPVPWDILQPDCDVTVAIDVSGGPEGEMNVPPGRFDALSGSAQLMMRSNIALRARISRPDVLWLPDVNRFGLLDFGHANEILKAVETEKDAFKHAVEKAVEAFLQSC